jgi:cation:H+ antiporter
MMPILLTIIGLIGLWIGTRLIINGSLGIARKFNLSHSFVGIAILAVGTDLPEVFVSVSAAMNQLNGIESSGIISGNAIGSSISQITIILGIAGLLLNFRITRRDLLRDGSALVTSILMLFVFGIDGIITRLEGAMLLALYSLYYYILVKTQNDQCNEAETSKIYSNTSLGLFLLIGFPTLIFSSHLVVQNATLLANKWGVGQSFIGIAIIGLGTSLPELAVSIGAAVRKSGGMSVGNIIGSNIFDGFVPIGLGGVISKIGVENSFLLFDLPFLLGSTILVLLFLISKRGVSLFEGVIMILLFIIYLVLRLFLYG